MTNNDELILKILKKTGMSEKKLWDVIKNKMAKGISEDGAIKMLASEKGIFTRQKVEKSEQPVVLEKTKYGEMNIASLHEEDKAVLRAAIVQVFDSKTVFFDACPICGKSVKEDYCSTHTSNIPQTSMRLSCILDDGTGNIRAVLFNNALQSLMGISADDAKLIYDKEGFKGLLNNIPLGKDTVFIGKVRLNSFFGKNEMVVSSVKNVSALEMIEQLQKQGVNNG